MFGKKILSIVGLLFIGNQLKSVRADCTLSTDCTISEGDCGESQFGYHIVSGHLCHITGADAIEETTKIGYFKTVDGNYVSKNHQGDVNNLGGSLSACAAAGGLGTDGKLCTQGSDTNVVSLSDSDDNIYLITNAAGIFNSETDAKVAIKVAADSFTLDTTKNDNEYCVNDDIVGDALTSEEERLSGFCSGCTVYSCTSGVCTTDLTLSCRNDGCDPADAVKQAQCNNGGYYLVGNNIYLCTGGSCTAQDGNSGHPQVPRGYFLNSGAVDSYIQCDGSTCSELTKAGITKTGCDQTGVKVGDFIYKSEGGFGLCTASDKHVSLGTGKYLITLVESSANAFTNAADATKLIIVDTTSDKAEFNAIAGDGNYVVNEDKLITTSGSLVQCSGSDGTCQNAEVTGYLLNVDTNNKYISCTGATCTASTPVEANDCTSNNAGDIIKITSQDQYKLCVAGGAKKIEVELTSSPDTIKYMVAAEKANVSNPFYTVALDGYFIVVDVTGTDAIVHTQDKMKYRYANSNQRIYDNKDETGASTDVCKTNGGKITEYTIDYCGAPTNDAYDYYKKGNEHTWSE